MKKNKSNYRKNKILKVNEKNNIDSIIEIFQRYGKKYYVTITKLEPHIQYQTKNTKITQTYTKTILNQDINNMINQLKKNDELTLIIIDNLTQENKIVNEKINQINKVKNIKTKRIKEEEIFKTLDNILSDGAK